MVRMVVGSPVEPGAMVVGYPVVGYPVVGAMVVGSPLEEGAMGAPHCILPDKKLHMLFLHSAWSVQASNSSFKPVPAEGVELQSMLMHMLVEGAHTHMLLWHS